MNKYSVEIHYISEGDSGGYYFAFCPDFGYSALSATGDTMSEALDNLMKVKVEVVKHLKESGRNIPESTVFSIDYNHG
jgi:predicted RNase H-like HicB family nuclease